MLDSLNMPPTMVNSLCAFDLGHHMIRASSSTPPLSESWLGATFPESVNVAFDGILRLKVVFSNFRSHTSRQMVYIPLKNIWKDKSPNKRPFRVFPGISRKSYPKWNTNKYGYPRLILPNPYNTLLLMCACLLGHQYYWTPFVSCALGHHRIRVSSSTPPTISDFHRTSEHQPHLLDHYAPYIFKDRGTSEGSEFSNFPPPCAQNTHTHSSLSIFWWSGIRVP